VAIEGVVAGQVFKGRRTSLRAGSASQVFSHSGTARLATKTLVSGLKAGERRTCLQNRWAGESSPAGSIPVRLRYRNAPLTAAFRAMGDGRPQRGPRSGPERPSPPPKSFGVYSPSPDKSSDRPPEDKSSAAVLSKERKERHDLPATDDRWRDLPSC
jgi:hypothetical protein